MHALIGCIDILDQPMKVQDWYTQMSRSFYKRNIYEMSAL